MQKRSKVFISYSHRDKDWLARLQVHLKPLVRSGLVDLWDDTRIQPADTWRQEIQEALDQTRVVILLVSADFMASDFVAGEELPSLLQAAQVEGVKIIPVIISPSRYEATPQLAQFQSVNPPSEPLIGMTEVDQEALFQRVASIVEELVNPPQPEAATTGKTIVSDLVKPATPAPPSATSAGQAARRSDDDVAKRVLAAKEITAAFTPTRYVYLSLIGVCVLVLLAFTAKFFWDEPEGVSKQAIPLISMLGAGGGAIFLSGQLAKMNAKTAEIVREQLGRTG